MVGTSAGSLVASFYASGKTGTQLQWLADTMDESQLTDWTVPFLSRGMLRGEALGRYVNTQLNGLRIEDLKMPLGIVATDLQTGDGILFRRGDIATAVRASSAVPSVLSQFVSVTKTMWTVVWSRPCPCVTPGKWGRTS